MSRGDQQHAHGHFDTMLYDTILNDATIHRPDLVKRGFVNFLTRI